MLTIQENRRFYAQHLHGRGIEFGALNAPLELPEGASAVRADHRSTAELVARYPGVQGIVPVDIVLGTTDLREIPDEGFDFLVACQVIEHLPNPLGAIETWARKVKAFGALFVTFPVREHCPDSVRPINSLAHLTRDYSARTDRGCDEDMLAFVWAWNPGYFPDPAKIESTLRTMWAEGVDSLDAGSWGRIGDVNRSAVETLLSNRQEEIHHHVFDYGTLIAGIEWVAQHTDQAIAVIDVGRGKGLLSEDILVLRKYPREFAESTCGRAVLEGHQRDIARAVLVENWTIEYVTALNSLVQAKPVPTAPTVSRVATRLRSIWSTRR